MFSVYTQLSPLLKRKNIEIYDVVFKLHSRVTVIILLTFCIVLSTKEYFGTPIDCSINKEESYKKTFIDNYCWITGTYTFKNQTGKLGIHYPYHGVGDSLDDDKNITTQKYYQWIIFILFIEAMLMFLPSFLWKLWERKTVEALCKDLCSPILPDDLTVRKQRILQYLNGDNRLTHNVYAFRFFLCELLNLGAIILNIIIIHMVLPQFWFEYRLALKALIQNDWILWDAQSAKIFPKLTKCRYFEYGPSGSIQRKDALCLLSSNIINDKIFAFIWVWFLTLAFISTLHIIYRFTTILCKCLRIRILRSLAHPCSPSMRNIRKATHDGNIGDWFLLYQLGRNINPCVFYDIIQELAINAKCHR